MPFDSRILSPMFCDGAKLCFDTNALAKAGPATVELLKRELTVHLKTDIAAIRNVKSGWDDGAHWISFYQNEAAIKSSFNDITCYRDINQYLVSM
jgi:hypothetical protein